MGNLIHYTLIFSKYTILALFLIFASLLIIYNIMKFDFFSFSLYGVITLGLFFFYYYFDKIIWAVESRPRTGAESMPGKHGMAMTEIDGNGEVKVEGIIWRARSVDGKNIVKGSEVIVEKVDGITLLVRKI